MTDTRDTSGNVAGARFRVNELVVAAETLAALGACLAERIGEIDLSEDLAAAVHAVAASALPELDELTDDDARTLGAVARAMLAQASSFAGDPGGVPPTWSVSDPALLTSLGQASAAFAPVIRDQLAPQLDGLAGALGAGGQILDVGAGVAALAIAFAHTFPSSSVVGLDIWKPSLELARANVERAGLADRIEVREQDVAELDDRDRYSLIWFAGPFIPPAIVDVALRRCADALTPGGWCVFAAYGGADPLQRALADLRTVRSGGVVLSDEQIVARLQAAGLRDGRPLLVDIGMPARLVAARR